MSKEEPKKIEEENPDKNLSYKEIQEKKPEPSEVITIKKSTYNNLIKVIVIAVAITTFTGGYSLGIMDNPGSLTNAELEALIYELGNKIAASPQATKQSDQNIVPTKFKLSFDGDPIKGNPDAPITIVEFSDFQCPYCSRFFEQTLPQIEKNYIETGKVKFVYRDLPLSFHKNALPVHIAAECADEQGRFWQFHDLVFEKQSEWKNLSSNELDNTLKQFADDVGLEASGFNSCTSTADMKKEVQLDSLAAAKVGVTGTPTFFIGSEEDGFVKLVGALPYSVFKAELDSQLG